MATKTIKIPSSISLSGEVELAADPRGEGKQRRFSMIAHSGDSFTKGGETFVVDLSSTIADREEMPMLLNHKPENIAGQAEKIEIGDDIRLSGFVSQVTPAGKEVLDLAGEGFKWQASIRVDPANVEKIDEGEEVEVNSRTFSGPIVVLKDNKILETSFVPLGAERSTQVAILSEGDFEIQIPDKEPVMAAATLPELKKAFPDSSDFVLSALEKELTMEAAQLAFTDSENVRLQADNDDMKNRLQKLEDAETKRLAEDDEKKKEEEEVEGNDAVGTDDDKKREKEASLSAAQSFRADLAKIEEVPFGDKRDKALSRLMLKNKEGHAACIAAANDGVDLYADYVASARRGGERR